MNPANARIMNNLEAYYQEKIPEGARFDRERFHAAVWDHFGAWPKVNAASKAIQNLIDVRECVVWERRSQ